MRGTRNARPIRPTAIVFHARGRPLASKYELEVVSGWFIGHVDNSRTIAYRRFSEILGSKIFQKLKKNERKLAQYGEE
jgi:hypothetical protein